MSFSTRFLLLSGLVESGKPSKYVVQGPKLVSRFFICAETTLPEEMSGSLYHPYRPAILIAFAACSFFSLTTFAYICVVLTFV